MRQTSNPPLQRTDVRVPLSHFPLSGQRGLWFAVVAISIACARLTLDTRIQTLVGRRAIDCWRVAHHGDRTESTVCTVRASKGNQPFSVRYDRGGIDSDVETAIVRSKNGRFIRLEYDSDVRGSGSRFWAKPRLTESPCVGKILKTHGHPPEFNCE